VLDFAGFSVYTFQIKEANADVHINYVKYYSADSSEAEFVDTIQKEVSIFVSFFVFTS